MTDKQFPAFYGVNECHTFQLSKEEEFFYVGMNVQGTACPVSDEFVLIFTPEQILDMYQYMVDSMIGDELENQE